MMTDDDDMESVVIGNLMAEIDRLRAELAKAEANAETLRVELALARHGFVDERAFPP